LDSTTEAAFAHPRTAVGYFFQKKQYVGVFDALGEILGELKVLSDG